MANVLIVEDDREMCEMLSHMVEQMGHEVEYVNTFRDGLSQTASKSYDVVFLDVQLPDGNGLDLLPKIRTGETPPEVVIMTGFADPDGAETAIKSGAWDYLQKPLSPRKITLPLSRVLKYRDGLKKVRRPAVALKLDGIVGNSPQIRACFDNLAHVVNSDANVLITGETGTGKEVFARAVHCNSSRSHRNFVVVDCAALPEKLVESSLFGYERGAFTGADRATDGLIKQADEGTLFLDEVGELHPSLQKAFLRVLQEHSFRPLGSKREIRSNFRLVAATNRDLEEMTHTGHFRKDLLFRLRSCIIDLPPLREHPEDIKDLVMHYMSKFSEQYEAGTKGISPEFFDFLVAYDWPGNVRELVNALKATLTESRHEQTLFPKHLPDYIRIQVARASVVEGRRIPESINSREVLVSERILPKYRDLRESALVELERKYFQDLMETTRGNVKEACEISGLGRTWLYTLLKKYEISRNGWPSDNVPS